MTDNYHVQNILGTVKVITIGRNISKQNKIKEFFDGILFEFTIGLDMTCMYNEFEYVSDLPDDIFDKYDLDKEYCTRWTKGQLGCFATEKEIIRNFYLTGVGNLTIFLDDAVPNINWKKNLINAYQDLPFDWDVLLLGTHLQNETSRWLRPIVQFKRLIISKIYGGKHLEVTKKYSKHLDKPRKSIAGIYGIIYSPNGLSKLINEPERMRKDQDDVLLTRLLSDNYLKAYVAYPQVVKEGIYDGSWTQKNSF